MTHSEARDIYEALADGKKVSRSAIAQLRAYIRDVRGAGPKGPHTVMPDRGASPRASFGSMKGGSRSWTNK